MITAINSFKTECKMGNRLSKIYTRTGDDGTSALADGSRIDKNSIIFEVMGDIDELNAHIGKVKSLFDNFANFSKTSLNKKDFSESLSIIQHLLLNIGGEIAMLNNKDTYLAIKQSHIDWLEQKIDSMNCMLPALKDFILPSGSIVISQLHIARSVCRRCERHYWALQRQKNNLNPASAKFLNRLSDFLFVTARFVAKVQQQEEVLWDKTVLNRFD